MASSRLRVRPLPQESHSSPLVSIFRCFVRRSPGYHAKARSREVPMREGQFLPQSTLKRSLFNERAVGQPGPTVGYSNIYKNGESTYLNKTCPLHQPLRRQVSKPARIDPRISPRAVSRRKRRQEITKAAPKPVVPECWTSANFPHARPPRPPAALRREQIHGNRAPGGRLPAQRRSRQFHRRARAF